MGGFISESGLHDRLPTGVVGLGVFSSNSASAPDTAFYSLGRAQGLSSVVVATRVRAVIRSALAVKLQDGKKDWHGNWH